MVSSESFVGFVAQFRSARPDLLAQDLQILDRLISEDWREQVAAVFAAVPVARWRALLDDCLAADLKMRTHASIVTTAQTQLKKAIEAQNNFSKVREYFNDRQIIEGDALAEAMCIISASLDGDRRINSDILLTRSRKTVHLSARSEAIGWLTESILYATGNPNYHHVMVLAQATLEEAEIDIDSVRNAPMPRVVLSARNNSKAVRSRRKSRAYAP